MLQLTTGASSWGSKAPSGRTASGSCRQPPSPHPSCLILMTAQVRKSCCCDRSQDVPEQIMHASVLKCACKYKDVSCILVRCVLRVRRSVCAADPNHCTTHWPLPCSQGWLHRPKLMDNIKVIGNRQAHHTRHTGLPRERKIMG